MKKDNAGEASLVLGNDSLGR